MGVPLVMSYHTWNKVGRREENHSDHPATLALWAEQRIVTTELLATLSVVARRWPNRLRHGQQFPAAGQVLGTVAIAEKSVMAAALEAAWQDLQQGKPQEFICRQRHL